MKWVTCNTCELLFVRVVAAFRTTGLMCLGVTVFRVVWLDFYLCKSTQMQCFKYPFFFPFDYSLFLFLWPTTASQQCQFTNSPLPVVFFFARIFLADWLGTCIIFCKYILRPGSKCPSRILVNTFLFFVFYDVGVSKSIALVTQIPSFKTVLLWIKARTEDIVQPFFLLE